MEIQAATAAGQLTTRNAVNDAWLINQLVMAVYHHYAFAVTDESTQLIADRLWVFLLAGLGGTDQLDGRAAAVHRGRATEQEGPQSKGDDVRPGTREQSTK